jgi:hypothetical protein
MRLTRTLEDRFWSSVRTHDSQTNDMAAHSVKLMLLALLILFTLACGVALSGRIDIGDDVGTETASPCP